MKEKGCRGQGRGVGIGEKENKRCKLALKLVPHAVSSVHNKVK